MRLRLHGVVSDDPLGTSWGAQSGSGRDRATSPFTPVWPASLGNRPALDAIVGGERMVGNASVSAAMAPSSPLVVQRCGDVPCGCGPEERIVAAREPGPNETNASGTGAAALVREVVSSGSGRPIDPSVRQPLEAWFGQDLSTVRIHSDARATASARSIHARAYTAGEHVVLPPAAGDPRTPPGVGVLAHELTHVIQQRSRTVEGRSFPGGLRVSDPSDRSEGEARRSASTLGSAGGGRSPGLPTGGCAACGRAHALPVQRLSWDDLASGAEALAGMVAGPAGAVAGMVGEAVSGLVGPTIAPGPGVAPGPAGPAPPSPLPALPSPLASLVGTSIPLSVAKEVGDALATLAGYQRAIFLCWVSGGALIHLAVRDLVLISELVAKWEASFFTTWDPTVISALEYWNVKLALEPVCACLPDRAVLWLAKWGTMYNKPLARAHLEHYLAGSGADFPEDLVKFMKDDDGVRRHLIEIIDEVGMGSGGGADGFSGEARFPNNFITQMDFTNQDWRYALGIST